MKKFLLVVSFVLFCLYSFTQINIQQDNRVNPVLKRAVSPQSGYNTYGRTGRFINMAVLNPSSHTISWFTCHGRVFDSTRLDDWEFEQVISKQLDPFTLYQNICDKYLADIAAAKDIYRAYGDKQLFERLGGNYRALFAMESVQAAKTPLQKLVVIENVRKKILTQLAWLNCANPASLHDDPLYGVNKEQAGVMVQTKDSTIYYNIDPTSAVARICLYKRSPEKLYVQNRQSEITDSVIIQPEKYELLQKEKTDVFLLYRGWLEMQWQNAMGLTRINREEYQLVNVGEASYRQLNAIRAKINLLISPDEKCIEQMVYETYRSETSEMYYIPLLGISYNLVQARGLKEYELSNHLGNVLATITDKKNGVPSSSNSSLIDHYEPDVVSAQDYYPFGMLQPGRSLSTGEKYRYGFNGQEMSNEVKGVGNSYTAMFWEYDSRIGRRWNIDPIYKNSPYETFGGNPIKLADGNGADTIDINRVTKRYKMPSGKNKLDSYTSSKNPDIVSTTGSISIKSADGDDVFRIIDTYITIDENGNETKSITPTTLTLNNRQTFGRSGGHNMKGYIDDRFALASNAPEWLLKYYSDKSGDIGVRAALAYQKDLPFVSVLNKIQNVTYTITGAYGLFRFSLSRLVALGERDIVGSTFDEVLPTQDYINAAKVAEYRAKLAAGEKLPPIIAYRQGGKIYIEDGHHKFVAHMLNGIKPPMIIRDTGGPVGYDDWMNTTYQIPPFGD